LEITAKDLQKYSKITSAQRKIREASDFAQEVMDYYMSGEKMTGIKLPFAYFDKKFRLRPDETTVLAGINGAGKSLFASQIMLSAMNQGYKCLSISLEMSPKAQLARMWRQSTLQAEPTMDAGIDFTMWAKDKLWFYDQHGAVDRATLLSVIRYAYDNFGVDLILVDSLMTMSTASDDWQGQKEVVQALCNVSRQLGVHVVLVAHARKGNSVKDRLDKWSIAGSADITNLADSVILLGRTFAENPDAPDAYLNLCKARHFDGAEGEIELYLDMASMNYHTENELPKKMFDIPANGGIMGELEDVGLGEIVISKKQRAKTSTVVPAPVN